MSNYSKFIGSIVGSGAGALALFLASRFGFEVDSNMIAGIVLAILGAVGVYAAPKNIEPPAA